LYAIPISDAMVQFIFAQPEIEVEDLLNILVMESVPSNRNEENKQEKELILMETQKKFFNEVLPEIIKDWNYVERRKFVRVCTGFDGIPYESSQGRQSNQFRITIEFNAEEETRHKDSLPAFHTCDNVMKLPFEAYDGSREIFQEKLQTFYDCVGSEGFSMR